MTRMEVRLTPDALADYKRLPFVIRSRVAEIFQRLRNWPDVSGAKPMRREWKGHFRIRTGDWRVVVKPVGGVLWVVRIDNRRDVYGD
jgi:mRNA-degrading endonuclease RelE of RelBE toxin-antitoxin system